MKKIFLYALLGATALMTSACNEDFNEDVAAPQEWPQEEAVTLPGFTVSAASTVDLAAGENVTVFSYAAPSLPEGVTIENFRLAVTPADVEGAATTEVKADSNGQVAAAELQAIIEAAYGKRPVERTLNAVVYANLMKEGQATLLTSNIVIKAIPEAPVIASAYYMVGDMFTWDETGMAKFNHSDKDVYEDPIFTMIFTTTKDNSYWKIIPQNNVDAGNIWADGVVGVEVDGDPAMEGKLVNVNAQAGKIEKAGMYSMTLNMMDYTYTIREIVPEYYAVGALQGWNASAAGMTCAFYPQDKMVHSYTTKFTGDANLKIWLGSDFGNWGAAYGAMTDGDNSATGALVSANAGAIVCPEKDMFYTLKLDFNTMTYAWTKLDDQAPATYEKIGLIGDFNGWGGDAELTEVTPHNWYLGGFVVEAAGGLKFRANADWGTNWGATLNVADQNFGAGVANGDNISVPAGTYNVFFNDITGEFVFKAVTE